jgi:transposase
MLTIEDGERFAHRREVGAFVGLQPKQHDSGESQPELGISKTGDRLLRSYWVQAGQCILRKGAPDSDLRAWGLEKAQGGKNEKGKGGKSQGGKRAKRRAVVGVARKLAVLLHRLWVTGEVYDPLYNRKAEQGKKRRAAA